MILQAGSELANFARANLERGYRLRLRVRGRSMFPVINSGDIIKVDPVPLPQIRKGDVILFVNRSGNLRAHRVVGRTASENGQAWLTKGDRLPEPDEPVVADQVLGRVAVIEKGTRKVRIDQGVGQLWSWWHMWISTAIVLVRIYLRHLRSIRSICAP